MFSLRGIVLVIAVVCISQVLSVRRTGTADQFAELGTFATADLTCLTRRLYKLQPKPQTISFVNDKKINYVKVTAINQYGNSGVSATVVGGKLATETLTISVDDTNVKGYFLNDILVEMRCAA